MKPFNLQEALAGKPVVTRKGLRVSNVTFFPTAISYKLAAIVQGYEEQPCTFTEDGSFSLYEPCDRDLFMAAQKKEGWINLYKNTPPPHTCRGCQVHSTQKEAEQSARNDSFYYPGFVAAVHVEWEE